MNPHDIVLFPAWSRRVPVKPSPLDPPPVPPAPTADEDLSTKPAAQLAFREAYYSGYGPAPAINWTYERNAQRYRDLYYRLHAEADGPIDRVRRAVTESGSQDAVLVRTFDDPGAWTEPGVRHLAANGCGGEEYRTSPLDDQWELYDLTADPIEAANRWADPHLHDLRQHLRTQLKHVRAQSIPERNNPWPYTSRRSQPALPRRSRLARLLRRR